MTAISAISGARGTAPPPSAAAYEASMARRNAVWLSAMVRSYSICAAMSDAWSSGTAAAGAGAAGGGAGAAAGSGRAWASASSAAKG